MQIIKADNSIKVDTENKNSIPDFENVVWLFNLLLKIDMRVNPHLYKKNNK